MSFTYVILLFSGFLAMDLGGGSLGPLWSMAGSDAAIAAALGAPSRGQRPWGTVQIYYNNYNYY
eukprot:10711551-Heterocapsa_arctica.AAC.1